MMILTSHEMLLYLSYRDEFKEKLHITPQRLRSLRHQISQRKFCEETVADYLTRLGCRLVRPRVELPCIVQDKNGRKFDEYTFVKMFFTPELAERYHADYRKTLAVAEQHRSINRPLFKHILKKRRAWIILDNMTLDSVWSYDPFGWLFDGDKLTQIRSMLENSVPMRGSTSDILTYHRPTPCLQPPTEESESHSTTIR